MRNIACFLTQLLLPVLAFTQNPHISSWTFSGVVQGFSGQPNEQTYLVSPPEVKRLDTKGAEFWFYITPKANLSCKQLFRVGWNFDQDLKTIHEGQTVNVQVFNIPTGDSGPGFKNCYHQARQWAYDGSFLTVIFNGCEPNSFSYQPAYSKYWRPESQYLITTSKRIEANPAGQEISLPAGNFTGSFLVKNGVYKVGDMNAPAGNINFEISKGGLFKYFVTYTYDGLGSPATLPSQSILSIQAPIITHNILNEQGIYWMRLNLPGTINGAAGKKLQIVMRFCDASGKLLPANPAETVYRDAGGYAATTSLIMDIPSNNHLLNDIPVWMPYYALNLQQTGYQQYQVFAYAEVFVDGSSLGISQKTPMQVLW